MTKHTKKHIEKKHHKQKKKPQIADKIRIPRDLPTWIVVIFFALTTSIFFWEQLSGDSFFWEDFTEYVYPVQSFAASESANGNLPFWNPYSFAGMPFLADLQVGFFYPFNRLLTFFVDADGKLPVGAVEFIIILHFFIAQLSMFFLSRYWKISSYGALIASVSYAFSLILVCHVIHPMIVYHLAWFPLIIMFFYKGITNRSIRSAIIAGLLLGMTMLSGHPQMTLYEGFFLLILFILYLITGISKREIHSKNIARFMICSAIPLIIGVGIFAVQYLPSNELAELSQREKMEYIKASEGSLEPKQLITAVVPNAFGYVTGSDNKAERYRKFNLPISDDLNAAARAPYYYYWETAFYFGLVALIFGFFGAATHYRSRNGAFLITTAVFGLLFALGSNGFIFPIFHELPLFSNFRNPARMIIFLVLALSLFSGMGFDYFYKNCKNKKVLLKLFLICGIVGLIAFIVIVGGSVPEGTPEQLTSEIHSFGVTALIIFHIIIFTILSIRKQWLKPAAGGIILTIIAFIDLSMAGMSFNSSNENPEKVYELNPNLEKLLSAKPPNDIYRVNMRMYQPRSYQALQRNQGLLNRIMLIEGYNPLILKRVLPPVNSSLSPVESRYLVNDIYNVKYQVDFDANNIPGFYTRGTNFPRAWLVHKAIKIKAEEVENKMRTGNYNLRYEVIIEEEPEIKLLPELYISAADKVQCLEYESNYFKYKINSEKPAILCFSEIWYPAWKAYLDGKPAKVLRANYCLRAVAVPAGEHIVEMRYESASFKAGFYISFITLICSAAGLFIFERKKK